MSGNNGVFSVRGSNAYSEAEVFRGYVGYPCIESQTDFLARMLLLNVNAFDSSAAYSHKLHAAPDAQIGKLRTPVPAEHIVRLAYLRKAVHG